MPDPKQDSDPESGADPKQIISDPQPLAKCVKACQKILSAVKYFVNNRFDLRKTPNDRGKVKKDALKISLFYYHRFNYKFCQLKQYIPY